MQWVAKCDVFTNSPWIMENGTAKIWLKTYYKKVKIP